MSRCLTELLRVNFARALVYRGQALVFVLTSLFPLVLMTVWLSLIGEVGPIAGWDGRGIVAYFLAATAVNHFTKTWLVWDWEEEFRSGIIATRLLRPVHPLLYYLTDHIARMAVTGVFVVPAIVIASIAIGDVGYASQEWMLAAAVGTVVLAFSLSFMISAVFTALSFWTTRTGALYAVWWGVGAFLSGWIAPFDLLPGWIRTFSEVLPFWYMLGFPVEVAMGRVPLAALAQGVLTTLAWLTFASGLYILLWSVGRRRFEAIGG